MNPERTEEALKRVIDHCVKILTYQVKTTDEAGETCKEIMNIIRENQNKK